MLQLWLPATITYLITALNLVLIFISTFIVVNPLRLATMNVLIKIPAVIVILNSHRVSSRGAGAKEKEKKKERGKGKKERGGGGGGGRESECGVNQLVNIQIQMPKNIYYN